MNWWQYIFWFVVGIGCIATADFLLGLASEHIKGKNECGL